MWPLLSSFALFGTLTAIPLLLWRNRSLEKLLRAQDQQYVDQESRLKLGLKQSELAFQQLELRHRELRRRLEEAGIYESFRQPVLLVGPRGVGKTSLLTHWRTPWSKARPSPTFRHNFAEVPVCNLPLPERRPHFADPDLMVPVIAQLLLRVHDFAGEVNAQKLVEKVIREEAEKVFAENCLLEQAFIKNPDMTIRDLLKSKIAEIGENLVIRRFVRYAVGEEI